MLFLCKGTVTEVGATEYQGKSFPFAKVLVQVGTHTDLVQIGLTETNGVKVGDKVEWPVEVSQLVNDRGQGRMRSRRVS